MRKWFRERNWHQLFELGVYIKGFNGVLEVLGGFSLLIISKTALDNIFIYLSRSELLEDPQDSLLNGLHNFFLNLSVGTKAFIAFYILAHGLLKVFLAVTLYKEKLWSYTVGISVISIFILYQIYRFSHNHSMVLAVLTLFDLLFLALIIHEYRYKLKHPKISEKIHDEVAL